MTESGGRSRSADPSKVYSPTIKHNSVAIVSGGSAVLGLGNMGPDAAMPVMDEPMKVAAARAIAESISADELSEEYIVPGIFGKRVARCVAHAVETAAHDSGVARKRR